MPPSPRPARQQPESPDSPGRFNTHTDVHVAAVLDPAGRLLETRAFPATTRGYAQLATWAESFGQVDKVGMEGTGSYGAGPLRFFEVLQAWRADGGLPGMALS